MYTTTRLTRQKTTKHHTVFQPTPSTVPRLFTSEGFQELPNKGFLHYKRLSLISTLECHCPAWTPLYGCQSNFQLKTTKNYGMVSYFWKRKKVSHDCSKWEERLDSFSRNSRTKDSHAQKRGNKLTL